MIKRNILTTIILAMLVVAGTANAAEIYNKSNNKLDFYGKAVWLPYSSNHGGQDGNSAYTCLGFKGETKINDQLIGYARWEYDFAKNDLEGNKTRLAYAGLKMGDYGSLDYGHNYGIVYDALSYTDILPDSDNFFVGRVSGVATYRNTNFFGLFDGLNFGVQYLSKNKRADNYYTNTGLPGNISDVFNSNGDGWGTSLSYKFDSFAIVGAYSTVDRTNAQHDSHLRSNRDKAERWATGLKYDEDNVYLAANYGETRNTTAIDGGFANKTQDIMLVAQYQFDFGLRPSIAYAQSKAKRIEEGIGDEDLVKYIGVGATYYFNKSMSTCIDYKINQININNKLGVNYDDTVALGIKYVF